MIILCQKSQVTLRSRQHFAQKKTATLLALSCAFLFSCSQVQAATNLMSQIHQSYISGNYADALAKLATAKPSPMVYYYSGLCYQGSNQLERAAQEYQMVLQTSKDKRLRYNSEYAIASLERYAATRTYKGQGNNFLKPVNRNVPGSPGGAMQIQRSFNPMYSRSYNPMYSRSYNPMYNRSFNPMYNRSNSSYTYNRTYSPTYSR
jgi:hypothetical protein